MFKAQVLGRLGKDATIYESSSTGTRFISFTLAVNTRNMGEDKTYWIDVRSFHPNHLKLEKYLTKGKMIMIGGDFNTGTMTDKSGVVRITHSITCDFINFVNTNASSNHTKTESNNNDVAQINNDVVSEPSIVYDNGKTYAEDEITMGNVKETVQVSSSGGDDDELPF